MDDPVVVSIASQADIVLLRMSVRDAARAAGLSLADQAKISLATSSVAEAAGVNGRNQGRATIATCSRDGRVGTQVTCIVLDDSRGKWPQVLSGIEWMVDELTVEPFSPGQIQIRLIKWKA